MPRPLARLKWSWREWLIPFHCSIMRAEQTKAFPLLLSVSLQKMNNDFHKPCRRFQPSLLWLLELRRLRIKKAVIYGWNFIWYLYLMLRSRKCVACCELHTPCSVSILGQLVALSVLPLVQRSFIDEMPIFQSLTQLYNEIRGPQQFRTNSSVHHVRH